MRAAARADGRDPEDERAKRLDIVDVRGGHSDDHRQSLRVGHNVQFAARFDSVDRIRPCQRLSFFARAEAAPAITELQSSPPRAPVSSRTTRCSRRRTPEAVQTENLR